MYVTVCSEKSSTQRRCQVVKAEMQLRGFGVDAIVTRKKRCDNVVESHHELRF